MQKIAEDVRNDVSHKNDQESKHTSSYQKKVLFGTAAGIALENMDIMLLSFSLTSIIATLGLNNAEAGLISTITNLGMLVGGIIFGILADKFGRVKIFSYTVIIFSLAGLFMFYATDVWHLYLIRFVAGIGAGGEYGACMSLISENFSKEKLGKASSIAAIGAQVGSILAAILAALVIPTLGWRMLYILAALPVFFVLYIRKGLKEPESFTQVKEKAKTGRFSLLFKDTKTAWQTIGLSLMVTVQIAGYFGLMTWLPSIMQKQLGLSVSGSSWWMVCTILGMCLGMLTFGTIMDKFGVRKSYFIFLLFSALSVYLIVLAKGQWSLLLATMLVGYFINGMYGGYGAIISRLYPTEIRATANNFIMNMGRAVGGFSSLLIGFLMDKYSLMMVVAFLSVIYLFSMCVMFSISGLKDMKNKQSKEKIDLEVEQSQTQTVQ